MLASTGKAGFIHQHIYTYTNFQKDGHFHKFTRTLSIIQTCQYSSSTMGKKFFETSFQLGMGLEKGQKQGREERKQEGYPTSAKYTQQM